MAKDNAPKIKPKDLWKELQAFIEELKTTLDPSKPFDPNEVVKKFKQIWKPLRKALEYARAMMLTGPKADKKLTEAIELGDKVVDVGTLLAFLAAVDKIWNRVRVAVIPLSHTGKPEFQAAVQKFISIVDWLTASV